MFDGFLKNHRHSWSRSSQISTENSTLPRGGTVPSTVTWYQISSPGIDKIEGESEFQEVPRYSGININATGTNVITLGDGNVVNAQFADLHTALSDLKSAVASSTTIDESQKLDVSVDIESIKDQLAKAEPDKTMIARLWSRIEQIATVGGFLDAVGRVGPLIAGLLATSST